MQCINNSSKQANISLHPSLPEVAYDSDHSVETKVLRNDGSTTRSSFIDENLLQIECTPYEKCTVVVS